ncbi:hypothetical protein, partial [Pseudomonas fluorescens]|uniref:hypothetical protein n=1 Tax=Pseudomonas fluorescens TaxID=294 RepID=UPI001CD76AD2
MFCPQEIFRGTTLSQPSQEMAIGEIPSEVTGQFLVWCSSFFNGLMSCPRIGTHLCQRVAVEMPEPIPIKDHEKETRLVNKRLIACALFVF